MKIFGFIFLAVVIIASGSAYFYTPEAKPSKRFVSLKAAEGNLRAGPDHRYYAIRWVFRWADLPLEVLEITKDQRWYLIRDWKGAQGWMHRHYFSSRRTVIVLDGLQPLYRTYSSSSRIIAQVEEGVIGRLHRCRPEGWCHAEFQTYRGWLPREALWGVEDADFEVQRTGPLHIFLEVFEPLVEVVDQIFDVFEAGVDSNQRSWILPLDRGTDFFRINRGNQAFVSSPTIPDAEET